MKTGERPIDIVKLFLVGHPEAGKTTLKNSMDQEKYVVDKSFYTPTPGIAVERKLVGPTGQLVSVWDCAGQMEYRVTHGMFLGAQNAIFLVVYDLSKEACDPEQKRAKLRQSEEIFYWLAFVKAVNKYLNGKKPQVAIVATHCDVIPVKHKDHYRDIATKNVNEAREKFSRFLDISDKEFILGESSDMSDFHTKLEGIADSLRRTRKIKGLCYKIEQNKDTWVTAGPPIISFSEYSDKVKQLDDVSERLIRATTIDLHDMGVIYRAHIRKEGAGDDFIVLDPNWLFSTIVGRLFAGTNMPSSRPKLKAKLFYTSCEICEVLEVADIDVKLLMSFMMHLELAVPFGADRYLVPAKLPSEMEPHIWSQNPDPPCNEIYGRRIQCSEDVIDIFTPTTFPCLQTRFLKKYEHTIAVQNRLKFTASGMSVLVQMTRDKRGIDVIVRGRGEDERALCFEKLREALGIISTELEEHSPGTSTLMSYLSSSFLKQVSPLSPDYIRIRTFTAQELVEAETHHAGKVYHDQTVLDRYDQVEDIICLGYDPIFIRHLGLECHAKWIPTSTLEAMDDYLASDDAESDGTCYRFLASAFGILRLENIEKECARTRSRITPVVIAAWLNGDKGRNLGNLRATIAHPGLVGNKKAVEVFDEMLDDHDIQRPYDRQGGLPSDIKTPSPEVLASRAVLRHAWCSIREGTTNVKLLSLVQEVLTLAEKEEMQFWMTNQGPTKAANRLAPMLLSKPECAWFPRLLQAFEQSNEQRLGNIGSEMKTKYDNDYRTLQKQCEDMGKITRWTWRKC
ncbi:death-associated protein kinase 1-like isoform X2 [Amphiura filiformis]